MSREVSLAIAMILAASSAWAQSPAPAPAATGPIIAPDADTTARVTSRFAQNRVARAAEAQAAPREHVQEMESTLNGMHALLKEMQASNASSRSKDPVAKANLEMWELLLTHLDKEFHQLQLATMAREAVEARRASMYNQALAKAAAEAARQTPPAPSTSTPGAPQPKQPKE